MSIENMTTDLAQAAGFLLALGCVMADRENVSDGESKIMKQTRAQCAAHHQAIAQLRVMQDSIDRLTEDNHQLENIISELQAQMETPAAAAMGGDS